MTGTEKSPFAALYKGNMRGKNSDEVSNVFFLCSFITLVYDLVEFRWS